MHLTWTRMEDVRPIDLALLDISAATGNPVIDAAAVRAKLSVLRATVLPANTDRVGIAAELRRLARDPRHAAHASAPYAHRPGGARTALPTIDPRSTNRRSEQSNRNSRET